MRKFIESIKTFFANESQPKAEVKSTAKKKSNFKKMALALTISTSIVVSLFYFDITIFDITIEKVFECASDIDITTTIHININ